MSDVTFPTLFKRTSKGATQRWDVAVVLVDGTPVIRTVYGQVGGSLQTADVRVKSGKNLGRANATSPLEQARREAEARWKKQQDKGYVLSADAEETAAALVRKPMLAHDYAKYKHQVAWPAHAQAKLDGTRCIATKEGGVVRLVSRMGKPILTMGHVAEQLAAVMRDGESWDGELYRHLVPFQTIVSLIKRRQPGSESVEYHVYDCIAPGPFGERFGPVLARLNAAALPNVVGVQFADCGEETEAQRLHDLWVSEGYEGAMIRANGCDYREGYRSRSLLKLKSFHEGEYRVIGVTQGKGKLEGAAIFRLVTEQGAEFDCLPRGTDAERKAYWRDRDSYVGRMMTVRFFSLTDSDRPVPRFPIGVGFRYEEPE